MRSEGADEEMSCSTSSEALSSSSDRSSSSNHDETDNEADRISDVMIVDGTKAPKESQSPTKSTDDQDESVSTSQQTASTSKASEQPDSQSKSKKRVPLSPEKAARKKSKAERRALFANPDKIVQNVLAKSQFKVPNLSQLVEEKFSAPDFKLDISKELSSIVYEDATIKLPDIDRSILPTQFDATHRVNVHPSAITMLQCIYEIPQRRDRFRKGKKRKRQNNNGNNVGVESNQSKSSSQSHSHSQNHNHNHDQKRDQTQTRIRSSVFSRLGGRFKGQDGGRGASNGSATQDQGFRNQGSGQRSNHDDEQYFARTQGWRRRVHNQRRPPRD